jgi:hypothetical protein
VRESQREQAAQGTQYESDGHIRRIRRRAVGVPFFFIAVSSWIALAAFIAEFVINLKAYPPVQNWNAFVAGLMIGDLSPSRARGLGLSVATCNTRSALKIDFHPGCERSS